MAHLLAELSRVRNEHEALKKAHDRMQTRFDQLQERVFRYGSHDEFCGAYELRADMMRLGTVCYREASTAWLVPLRKWSGHHRLVPRPRWPGWAALLATPRPKINKVKRSEKSVTSGVTSV